MTRQLYNSQIQKNGLAFATGILFARKGGVAAALSRARSKVPHALMLP